MTKLDKIKKERESLEILLLNKGVIEAVEVYEALKPYFEEVDGMESYYPIGRIRLAGI